METALSDIRFKVCGMKEPANIKDVSVHKPDFMGFIFYKRSPRFVGGLDPTVVRELPDDICSIGVFVNAGLEEVMDQIQRYGLDMVQLHGHETPEYCRFIKDAGIAVIKAIHVGMTLPLDELRTYSAMNSIDYFLFDTSGSGFGGTGKRFNWSLLRDYNIKVPFFLSGGIGLKELHLLSEIEKEWLFGVDVNSGFEIEPGFKDPARVGKGIELVRSMRK